MINTHEKHYFGALKKCSTFHVDFRAPSRGVVPGLRSYDAFGAVDGTIRPVLKRQVEAVLLMVS